MTMEHITEEQMNARIRRAKQRAREDAKAAEMIAYRAAALTAFALDRERNLDIAGLKGETRNPAEIVADLAETAAQAMYVAAHPEDESK